MEHRRHRTFALIACACVVFLAVACGSKAQPSATGASAEALAGSPHHGDAKAAGSGAAAHTAHVHIPDSGVGTLLDTKDIDGHPLRQIDSSS